jgi:hypothetical protein
MASTQLEQGRGSSVPPGCEQSKRDSRGHPTHLQEKGLKGGFGCPPPPYNWCPSRCFAGVPLTAQGGVISCGGAWNPLPPLVDPKSDSRVSYRPPPPTTTHIHPQPHPTNMYIIKVNLLLLCINLLIDVALC